jgi:hypothetical protein
MSRIEYVPNMRGWWYGNTVGIFKEVRTQDIGDKIKVVRYRDAARITEYEYYIVMIIRSCF